MDLNFIKNYLFYLTNKIPNFEKLDSGILTRQVKEDDVMFKITVLDREGRKKRMESQHNRTLN